jgi:adenine-specific DNA-methyltransferase
VWYLPENRAVADIWVAVFSRETVKFILNTSGAKNLTCFHGLYAKAGHKNLAPLVTLYLNSSWGSDAFAQVNRFYGDGLNKLEPKDVEALRCPKLPTWHATEADKLTKHLADLEILPAGERNQQVDALIARYLDLPSRSAV